MPTVRIPLFPLEIVLLPGNSLPLHIFEPRYKLMVRRSIDDSSPFGMVLALDNGVARVGCTAEVTRVIKRYDDGQMDIETLGRAAYRIRELHQEHELLEATVELLEDDARPAPPEDAAVLRDLYAQCHALLHAPQQSPPPPLDDVPGASLCYQIAGSLPLDLGALQELLAIRSESARCTRLAEQLKEFLPQLARVQRSQSKASGNGHGLN